MTYLHKIDDKIVDALYCKKIKEERKIHFNAILEIVKKSLPSMTRRVLSRHLNLMEEHGIIHRDTVEPYHYLPSAVEL